MNDFTVLRRIFTDAHVIDVDLSMWDKKITFLVFADHYENWEGKSCPLLAVALAGVRQLRMEFKHYDIQLDDPTAHVQWLIDCCLIEQHSDGIRLVLSYHNMSFPVVEVQCEAIEVHRIDNSLLDKVFPDWRKPGSGLARPGIEELARVLSSRGGP